MVGFELSKAVNANNVFLVKHSELEGRLDSYFYKPDFYELDKKLIKNNNVRFCHLIKSILNGYDFRDYKEFGTPYIKVANVKQGEFDFRKIQYIDFDSDEISKSIQLKKGNLLLTRKGTFGNALSLEKNYDFVISSEVFYIELTEQINSKYLEIFFNSALGQKQFDRNKIGAIMGSLSQEAVKSIKIPLPTLDFQENIVETHQAAYLKKQQKEVEAQALLDGIDGYLLNELGITLPQQDNRLEKRVFTVPFSEVTGGSLSPDNLLKKKKLNFSSKYKFYVLGTIAHMYQPQTITQQDMTESGVYKVYGANGHIGFFDKYNHENSEVLVTCRGATCGEINLSEHKSWITGNAMVVKPIVDFVIQSYLFEILKCLDMSVVITGSAQPQITRENLKRFSIPVPPIEVQNEIVTYISQIRAQAKQLQADAAQVLATAKAEIERMILGENG